MLLDGLPFVSQVEESFPAVVLLFYSLHLTPGVLAAALHLLIKLTSSVPGWGDGIRERGKGLPVHLFFLV